MIMYTSKHCLQGDNVGFYNITFVIAFYDVCMFVNKKKNAKVGNIFLIQFYKQVGTYKTATIKIL